MQVLDLLDGLVRQFPVLDWVHFTVSWLTGFMAIWRMQCIGKEPHPPYLHIRRALFGLLAAGMVINGTRPVITEALPLFEDIMINAVVGALLVLSPLQIPREVKSRVLF